MMSPNFVVVPFRLPFVGKPGSGQDIAIQENISTSCDLLPPSWYGDIDLGSIGSGTSLLPDGTNPFPEPLLPHQQLGAVTSISSQKMPKPSIKISFKITHLKCYLNLPGASWGIACWIVLGKHNTNQPHYNTPDNKVHGANMGPTWGRQGPMLAPWTLLSGTITLLQITHKPRYKARLWCVECLLWVHSLRYILYMPLSRYM